MSDTRAKTLTTAAADAVREAAGDAFVAPRLGLVLGSGLGGLADSVEHATAIPYADLPGFPVGSVVGHAGRLVLGTLEGTPVVVLQGRAHLYEGIPASDLAVPTRTVRALGAETLVLTNAAGSLNPEAGPGELMALNDHINLMGANPLMGPNDDAIGPRFVGLGDAYDLDLRTALHAAAEAEGIDLHEGVYLAVAGPSFETPAEIRAFKVLGADAVGMSTVPEVLVARHCGLRVAAVSAITNLAEGLGAEVLTHEHTLQNAARAAEKLQRVLRRFVKDLA
ncbi:MAG TPA: purine-nucleoside phosphorylase [Baekduia sp.]|uniref:purine-nucleoside phosphorylase n=1 Tax=Baekduia sp. TaxID=2600305 RepID=UPI002D78D265|nr:purine-nucleoside phosphorylase [Baekduia sp.]HET6507125.1 purine-nucleoside phosphorylase [Baekduia sp.]